MVLMLRIKKKDHHYYLGDFARWERLVKGHFVLQLLSHFESVRYQVIKGDVIFVRQCVHGSIPFFILYCVVLYYSCIILA